MVFESITCLFLSLIPKPKMHEEKILNFSKWRLFSNSLLFESKIAFLKILADFVTRFEKIFFHLKARQTRMQINVYKSIVFACGHRYKFIWSCCLCIMYITMRSFCMIVCSHRVTNVCLEFLTAM